MSSELRLTSFEVEGFRALRHVRVSDLGRVNLVVGKNNSGKTSLLEALRIYLSRSPAIELFGIIRAHAGLRPGLGSLGSSPEIGADELEWAIEACRRIAWGGFEDRPTASVLFAGENHRGGELAIRFPWLQPSQNGGEAARFFTLESPLLQIARGSEVLELTLEWLLRSLPSPQLSRETGVVYVPSAGLDPHALFSLWKEAAAAGDAGRTEAALRTVIPTLDRVVVVDHAVLLQLEDTTRPVPLESVGEGTQRVVGLSLAMVRARGGIVAIDEVENGLHHSVQQEIWNVLYELAEELDVQVFATTHSWESVVAFQAAANGSRAKGMLYRLERTPGGFSRVERYTEEEVAVAAEQEIEVR